MCAVSMVSDYYTKTPGLIPGYIPPTVTSMDYESKQMLREIIEKLDKLDKRLNDKECMDEKKKKFLEALYYPEPVPQILLG